MAWIRHGDVVLEKVVNVCGRKRKFDTIVLAEGEVTGHKHVLSGQLLESVCDGQRYVEVKGQAELSHNDHDTLVIPEGSYKVVMQREVDLLGQVRQVMD